jgi:hypothetical protein
MRAVVHDRPPPKPSAVNKLLTGSCTILRKPGRCTDVYQQSTYCICSRGTARVNPGNSAYKARLLTNLTFTRPSALPGDGPEFRPTKLQSYGYWSCSRGARHSIRN